jgi:RND family efflux transporter MFP subunit
MLIKLILILIRIYGSKETKMKYLSILLLVFYILSCSSRNIGEDNQSKEEVQAISITQWTEKMELFMEYPVPVKLEPGKFVIHLTNLKDFKAVREGMVILNFKHESEQNYKFEKTELLREGIFNPVVTLPLSGKYIFTIDYKGKEVQEFFNIGNLFVYESKADIPEQAENNDTGKSISFLKEQQWKIDFQTKPAMMMPIRSSVTAIGEIIPRQQSYAEIVSPVDGLLDVRNNQNMAIIGSFVQEGQTVAILSPPLNVVNSWAERKLSYLQAKSEFERAEKLKEKNAISQRDYEEIKRNYLTQKAGYESLTTVDIEEKSDNSFFQIKSPIRGIISEVSVLPGQKVNAGQKLITIIDPSFVWLKVIVFEKDYYKIRNVYGASLRIPGMDSLIVFDKGDMRLLNIGDIIDSNNRTIPILFELKNPKRIFKIGQMLQVELYASEEKNALCVPKEAIYDDDSNKIIFIHKEGESFEKRTIETGNSFKGFVEVIKGLKEGERVVTRGGYQVKLASTSSVIGHPHAH